MFAFRDSRLGKLEMMEIETIGIILSKRETIKLLIRLCGYAACYSHRFKADFFNHTAHAISHENNMSLVVRKPAFFICENKDADQLRGNCEADQNLCFRYTDSKIPLLPKSKISSIFYSCTACFVWDLVENPEDRFSHNEAHILLTFKQPERWMQHILFLGKNS